MKQAIFIRHGQSTANIGLPTKNFAQVPLTELGWEQARDLARRWEFTPSRIVVSPYLRTQQTAQATIERFPTVPVEIWPVHEFTFWDPAHWNGSEPAERMDEVDRYWKAIDAEKRFGDGAESFAMMLLRAQETFARLEAIEAKEPVLVFTHGHFIQALRLTVLHPSWSAGEKMAAFREFDAARWVTNTELVPAEFDGTRWKMD